MGAGWKGLNAKWLFIWAVMFIGILSIGAWALRVYILTEPVSLLAVDTAYGHIDILLYIGLALISVSGTLALITKMKEMEGRRWR
jgi:hypothetical protein